MAMKTRMLKEIEFLTPGEQVEGRLLSAIPIRFKDGGVNMDYLVRRDDGHVVHFKGASMLNKLLFRDDVGKLIIVTYRGTDGAPVKEGMSPRKIFDVQVDEDSKIPPMSSKLPTFAGLNPNGLDSDPGITDDDIPF